MMAHPQPSPTTASPLATNRTRHSRLDTKKMLESTPQTPLLLHRGLGCSETGDPWVDRGCAGEADKGGVRRAVVGAAQQADRWRVRGGLAALCLVRSDLLNFFVSALDLNILCLREGAAINGDERARFEALGFFGQLYLDEIVMVWYSDPYAFSFSLGIRMDVKTKGNLIRSLFEKIRAAFVMVGADREDSSKGKGPCLATIADNYTVLDGRGWTITSQDDYRNWAANKDFEVGDVLIFNFPTQQHDVVEVTKESFDSYSVNNMISLHLNGPARIRLNTTGNHYFICTFDGHCSAGQKLAISVKPDEDAVSPFGSTVPPQTPRLAQPPPSNPNICSFVVVSLSLCSRNECFISGSLDRTVLLWDQRAEKSQVDISFSCKVSHGNSARKAFVREAKLCDVDVVVVGISRPNGIG
ncbi:hypothetical protein Sjap_008455 [Stephania japonica]|uniref:Phytocyanin domain-containing protein n=1 Tax=Stephania japonica TaxID=461633 RepID=A0AAP0PEG6_9MAGN